VADGLKDSGYDLCSTASNHTMDHGAEGAVSTLEQLDRVGIAHTGSARTQQEAAKPLVVDVNGTKVGWVSYTFAFNSGTKVPADKPWMSNVLKTDAVIAEARKARQQGAEVVVASLHWGVEGEHEATSDQRAQAKKILADPAVDLIIGHHAHVVQPFEKVNGKWVAYGLGNHVARHAEPKGPTEEGALARFTFRKEQGAWTVGKAEYVPTLVVLGPPIRLVDLTTQPAGAATAEALDRTDGIVRSLGADTAGLTRPGN
jgi:poly-gamma-glutamate synthesis protein (capsule biosynthesis protein)